MTSSIDGVIVGDVLRIGGRFARAHPAWRCQRWSFGQGDGKIGEDFPLMRRGKVGQ